MGLWPALHLQQSWLTKHSYFLIYLFLICSLIICSLIRSKFDAQLFYGKIVL